MSDGTPPKTPWFRSLVADLAEPPSGPRVRPFCRGGPASPDRRGLTVLVRLTGFDLEAERWIYGVGGGSWALGDHPFWKTLYYGGTVPAALAVFAALGLYLSSWRKALARALAEGVVVRHALRADRPRGDYQRGPQGIVGEAPAAGTDRVRRTQ